MLIDPAARNVHPRRRYVYLDGTGLNEGVRRDVYRRGVFEGLFGHPTDVNTVWAARETVHRETYGSRQEEGS